MSKPINKTKTPIHISNRHGGGITIYQGTSKLMLSGNEIAELVQALNGYLSDETTNEGTR